MSDLVRRQHKQEPSAFLERKLAEGAARFSLYVLAVDGSRTHCDAWAAELGFEELRDCIEEKAARVAATGSTVCNFVVTAEGPRNAEGRSESLGFEAFRVSSQIAKTTGTLMSEPASEAGLLAQLMRHNEHNLSTTFALQGVMFERLAAENRDLRAQSVTNDERRLSTFQLLEDLLSHKHTRELEEMKAAESLKLKGKAVEAFTKLLPIGFDAVMGKVHPEGAALTSANLARELFNSLQAEQLNKILSMLDPEQGAMVARLFLTLGKQEAKEGNGDKPGETQH